MLYTRYLLAQFQIYSFEFIPLKAFAEKKERITNHGNYVANLHEIKNVRWIVNIAMPEICDELTLTNFGYFFSFSRVMRYSQKDKGRLFEARLA